VGATLVEYALIVGVLVVVLIGVIQFVTDEGSSELADRGGRVGAPDVDATGATPSPTSPTSTPGPTVTTTPPAAVDVVVEDLGTCWTLGSTGNSWNARFTFTLVDQITNGTVEGVNVGGTYRVYSGGSQVGPDEAVTGQSATEGRVSLTLPGLRTNGANQSDRVEFQLTSITGPNVSASGLPLNMTVRRLDPSASPQCVS
jgi:Flp pilus assembly pilin Flp